jgi:hypothetical protein
MPDDKIEPDTKEPPSLIDLRNRGQILHFGHSRRELVDSLRRISQ